MVHFRLSRRKRAVELSCSGRSDPYSPAGFLCAPSF
jgi:hypothetical protein